VQKKEQLGISRDMARPPKSSPAPTLFNPDDLRAARHLSANSTRAGTMYHQKSNVITQDFIAKIRYSNALPPPPCPPKLLDIPNTGLSSGQYTSASFASRLAREQPLNIEADAELGMPIDLVGIPKVFDNDESGKSTHSTRSLTTTDAL
jgi:hypothetical protein